MRTWAMVQSGQIVNTVYASDSDPKNPAFIWVEITNYSPMPSIGWTTSDNVNFTPPA